MALINRNMLPHNKYMWLLIFLTIVSLLLQFSQYKLTIQNFDLSHTTKHLDFLQFSSLLDSDNPDALVISNEHQGNRPRTEAQGWTDRNSSTLFKTLQTNKLIDTPGCFLPKTNIMPKGFSMKKNTKPYCGFERRLVRIDDTRETLHLKPSKHRSNCKFIEMKRHETKDSYAFGDEVALKDKLNISDKELFATKCGKYINFDAHFPIQKAIQDKIEHWKNNKERPINVLFMGFDTTSRLHYHRSLVKTLPLMTKMGFVDFKGYHSAAPYTLDNFFAFLVGMSRSRVRATCTPNWLTPFDTCPLIWKYFDLNKYVTMYVEDRVGSFNWGKKAGFNKRPTDYYPNPMFLKAKKMRKHLQLKYKRSSDEDACMSTMNPQKFILNYNLRFLKKFSTTVPFFSFSWFANPFHDSSYALYGFDDQVFKFFKFLNSSESDRLRENTLIILNADHGDRNSELVMTGYSSFTERALPGLFIRLPENLLKRYPELCAEQNLQTNSERLVGGMDIYHTFLHLLHIQGLNSVENLGNLTAKFKPALPDRSSLFVPVSDQRKCEDISVPKEYCVCNVSSKSVEIDNPVFTDQLINYGIKELNTIVNSSQYRNVCLEHTKPMRPLIAAYLIAQTETNTDTLLRFVTNPKSSQFEVQLRIHTVRNTSSRFEIIGHFHRLNQYRDTSWCVGAVTDEDKYIKVMCYCKGKKPKRLKRVYDVHGKEITYRAFSTQ